MTTKEAIEAIRKLIKAVEDESGTIYWVDTLEGLEMAIRALEALGRTEDDCK